MKTIKIGFIVFISCLFCFISCNNSVSPFSSLEPDPQISEANTPDGLIWVNATGSFFLDSDFAEQIPAVSNNVTTPSIASRAAFPETVSSMTGITYTVTATAGTLTSTGTVDSTNGTYTIGLAAGYPWTITIEIKNGTDTIMSGSTANTVTPSATDPFVTVTETITLSPAMGSNPGNIVLSVDYSGISGGTTGWKLKVTLSKDGADPATIPAPVTLSGDDLGTISFSNIATGIWNAELKFLDSNDIPLYIDNQAINVYSNLTTRRWGASGGAIVYDSTNSKYIYKLTDALLAEYALTTIWVGTTKVGTSEFTPKELPDVGTGTFVDPFKTLSQAINAIPASSTPKAYTINISGSVNGGITLASYLNLKASSITFTGTTGSGTDSISVSSGTVLSIQTTAKIIIKKLTITGGTSCGISSSIGGAKLTLSTDAVVKGNSSNGYGGGVYLQGESDNKAVLVMESSAKISGNHGGNGGGLYLQNAILYMSGNSLIGDKLYNGSPVTSYATSAARSNYCTNTYGSGGAIYLDTGGEIWMGYTAPATGTNGVADDSFTGGMFYNYAPGDGGAINQNGGVIHIHKGDISFNATGEGGAIYCNSSNLEIYMEGGTLKGNYADCGGAIYNSGKFYMTGGVIGGEEASYKNTANTAGGAIYQYGTFEVSGSAKIWPGSLKTNDVYICSNKLIKLANDINTSGNTSEAKMTLTPVSYARQKPILEGSSYIDDNYEKFETSDSEWIVVPDGTNTARKGKLECPNIYVASTYTEDSGRGSDISKSPANSASREGTKTAPYNTVAEAAAVCWCASTDYYIIVSGELSGLQQVIGESVNGKANSITLTGYTGSSSDIINRNLRTSSALTNGSALYISTTVPIKITKITIQYGNKSGAGGGICIDAENAIVNIVNGASIYGNKATNGGAIYVASGAYLGISNGAKIGKSGQTISDANITETSISNFNQSNGNCAGNGGGIYNGGTLIIGGFIGADKTWSEQESDTTDAQITACGATSYGGGVYNAGTMFFYSGKISGTYSALYGGGIANTSELTIGDSSYDRYAEISGTKVSGGGGGINNSTAGNIYIKNNVKFTNNRYVASGTGYGGAIYNEGNVTITGGTFGTYNTSFNSNANKATKGGAICHAMGTLIIGGDVFIPLGYTASGTPTPVAGTNDIYFFDGAYVKISSALSNHTANNQIGITPDAYKYGRYLISCITSDTFTVANYLAEIPKFKTTATAAPDKYFVLTETRNEGSLSLGFDKFTQVSDITGYQNLSWSESSIMTSEGDYLVKTSSGKYAIMKYTNYGGNGELDFDVYWVYFTNSTTKSSQGHSTFCNYNGTMDAYVDIDGDTKNDINFYETNGHDLYMMPITEYGVQYYAIPTS